jgi:propionyl-CoA carboxylase beta chain
MLGLQLRVCIPLSSQDIAKHTAEYAARFANPMVAAQRGFVDDIIDPQNTRRLICNDLRVLRTKEMPEIKKKHSNIPL